MTIKEEMTTPVAPVGAGAEQSSQNQSTSIIPEINEDFNTSDDFFQQMMNPYYLKTVSMNELYETVFQSRPPIIDGLLYPGVYLFVGAPKFGKSFLMAQLAYHVSKGEPLWNYTVHKSDVLYLALEDNYERIQKRSYRMFGTESIDNLRFAVMANTVDGGLERQLEGFLHQHPETRLIIIDTLQKVREASNECSYGNDYQVITRLKQFADNRGICILLVHHTRKQKADDSFDMISGTNGLLGAADGAFILEKEKRTGDTAVLEVSGRDQPEQKLILKKNMERLTWELERAETELWKAPPDPILEKVADMVSEKCPEWDGSPTELAEALHMSVQETGAVAEMLETARRMNLAKREPEPEEEELAETQAVEDTAYFQMRQRISDLLSNLNETDAKLLTLRFGLEKGLPMSAAEVGKILGMTADEVSAREAEALKKLRNEG